MKKHPMDVRELPVDRVEMDPDQPRKGINEPKGMLSRLRKSIEEMGIQQPLAVNETADGRFIILDGHRRFQCAKDANFETVPCRVYRNLEPGEFEFIRFEIQNNRRPWNPGERANAFYKIKKLLNIKSDAELARHLHLSHALVNYALNLREDKVEYIGLMERYGLKESYQVEFMKVKPKIRKIRDLEIDTIIHKVFEKIKCGVISNAQDLRTLKRVLLRSGVNEDVLYQFFTNPDMTIKELERKSEQSGLALTIENLIKEIGKKRSDNIAFTKKETPMLKQLKELLNELV